MFVLQYFGIYPEQFVENLKGVGWFLKDYRKLKRAAKTHSSQVNFGRPFPMLRDKNDTSGRLSGHYFHQDLLVAQKIFDNCPKRHVDIGSRTDGFVAHVASFREIEVIDIRETLDEISNIKFVQADFMSPESGLKDYTDSVSCLHVIEHFGLGRYGDPIDLNGHWKGLDNIFKLLKKGGKFYFSTPIGPEKIHFNAHRVFNLRTLVDYFSKAYSIDSFSYVDDAGILFKDIDFNQGLEGNFGCNFGCAIFELTKK
ncbi:MAG: DUF268 domain-containing protein [Cyclobacteriaceae bacterium]